MGKPRLAIHLPYILDRVDSTCRPYPPRSLPSVYSMVAKLLASRLAEHRKVLYPWLRTGTTLLFLWGEHRFTPPTSFSTLLFLWLESGWSFFFVLQASSHVSGQYPQHNVSG